MAKILINPPPKDKRCQCCGRHISQLKPFGGPGDPLVGDFKGALLVKTFRQTDPLGGVNASWECRDCILLNKDKYNIIDEFCPFCETEVELEKVFTIQACPNCNQPIFPCGMCDMDKVDCSKCPLKRY